MGKGEAGGSAQKHYSLDLDALLCARPLSGAERDLAGDMLDLRRGVVVALETPSYNVTPKRDEVRRTRDLPCGC